MIQCLISTFKIKKPPTKRRPKAKAILLKCLSISPFIGSPNLAIRMATRKKRAERLIAEAKIKGRMAMPITPLAIVKILYGMGENPARNTKGHPHSSYQFEIWINFSLVKPGTYS